MPKAVRVAQSGLQGWRAKVADQVAVPVSRRTPLSAEQVRATVGGAFVVLSALYLVKTAKAATQEFKR
jgi:hypothetical protein